MGNRRLFAFIASNCFLSLHSLDTIIDKDVKLLNNKSNKSIFNQDIILNVKTDNKYINKPLHNYKRY